MRNIVCDVLVVGCGSGGIGAAIGAAERGAKVVVIDKNHVPGGVVSMCWVHNWEPTCGNAPVTRRLWERMRSYPLGAADMDFTTSSRGADGKKNPTMPFELWAYQHAVMEEFDRFEHLDFMFGTQLLACETDGRKLKSVTCGNGVFLSRIQAKCYVDASGDIALSRMCGCAHMLGENARGDYNEALEPDVPDRNRLNKVNWIYRVREGRKPSWKIDLRRIPDVSKVNYVFTARMPGGDYTVNTLGTGYFCPERPEDYHRVAKEQYDIALNSYYWLVGSGMYPDWELVGLAPQMGIRESYRLKARHVMSVNDVLDGGNAYRKSFVAMTDHPLDVHGTNLHELGSVPYGIPYESLLAVEYDNLFVGGRGIGATHAVTGSCRLSRTVMTYGNAAGKAAAICALNGVMPEDIAVGDISEFAPCPDFVYQRFKERQDKLLASTSPATGRP